MNSSTLRFWKAYMHCLSCHTCLSPVEGRHCSQRIEWRKREITRRFSLHTHFVTFYFKNAGSLKNKTFWHFVFCAYLEHESKTFHKMSVGLVVYLKNNLIPLTLSDIHYFLYWSHKKTTDMLYGMRLSQFNILYIYKIFNGFIVVV